jgi:hypothetical protein
MRDWAELKIVKVALFAGILDGGAIRVANGYLAAHRIVNDFRHVSLAQLQFEVQLGMTPMSRAAVTRDHGKSDFDLVAAMAQQQPDDAEEAGEPEASESE